MATPLERRPYVDAHSHEVTPAIYTLLFSGILCELEGNDLIYAIQPWEYQSTNNTAAEKAWQARLGRGSNNCYHDREAMVAFCINPCTWVEAMEQFHAWLKERGVTEKDEILHASIWW